MSRACLLPESHATRVHGWMHRTYYALKQIFATA
jgi:hypothetical protein